MLIKQLFAIGLITGLLAGCGGGGEEIREVASLASATTPSAAVAIPPHAPAVPPNAAKPILCPATAAALQKSSIKVGTVDREYYDSAPADYAARREYDARGIVVVVNFHGADQTGQDGAASTCWHEIGDSKGFITVFPSAIGGRWNTNSDGTAADEVAFLKTLLSAIKSKYNIATNAMVYYTGLEQGSKMAQAMAMQAPQFVGGVASVGGTADAEVFDLPAAKLPPTTMAAWIIKRQTDKPDPTEPRQVAYWNQNNGVYTPAVTERSGNFTTQVYASAERPAQRVKVSTMRLPFYGGKALSEEIWDTEFAKTVRFFDDNRTNGSMRDNLSIEEMKLIDVTKELIPGSPRRWLTYLPSNYAAVTANGQKLPVVISLHGRNGSGRWQALISKWHEVAEERGFIVAYPHGIGATWTTSIATDNRDVLFMQALIEELKTQYAVDSTRIFMNGASQGSAMTNRMAVQYPLLFAGIAPCYSGHLGPANYANAIVRTDVPMPTWLCRGQDEVPSDFPGGTAGEAASQVFWRETVNKNTGLPTLQQDGRFKSQIWDNGVAEFRWTVVEYLPHFWAEGISRKIWDEMFSKYQRTASGQLVKVP
jgi:poly(3-hydroxybutyrate) depolymerase